MIIDGVAMAGRVQRRAMISTAVEFSEIAPIIRLDVWSMTGPKAAIAIAMTEAETRELCKRLLATIPDMKRWHREKAKSAASKKRGARDGS